jgi:hypothetical protein
MTNQKIFLRKCRDLIWGSVEHLIQGIEENNENLRLAGLRRDLKSATQSVSMEQFALRHAESRGYSHTEVRLGSLCHISYLLFIFLPPLFPIMWFLLDMRGPWLKF